MGGGTVLSDENEKIVAECSVRTDDGSKAKKSVKRMCKEKVTMVMYSQSRKRNKIVRVVTRCEVKLDSGA